MISSCLAFSFIPRYFPGLVSMGLLPTRASLMLDVVALAMLPVTIALAVSIFQVRVRKNKVLHRAIQVATAVSLALALIAFEIDIRFFSDWRELARPSPYFESGWVDRILRLHLCFAIPTPIVWGILIFVSLRRYRTGFDQGGFNQFHRIAGRIAAAMMFITAITGWTFYYVAFVA